MSNRKKAIAGGDSIKNPATIFLNWNAKEKKFTYFDKEVGEKGENVELKMPLKFLYLDMFQLVRGWSDALKGTIISNEVKNFTDHELNVVCYHKNNKGEKTNTTIVKGFYRDIKPAVISAGAKYHKSVFAMLEDGTIINFQFKGGTAMIFDNFVKKNRKRLAEEWVYIDSVTKEKNGAVVYYVPEFKLNGVISEKQETKADANFDVLEAYFEQYTKKPITEIQVIEEEVIDLENSGLAEEDLDF